MHRRPANPMNHGVFSTAEMKALGHDARAIRRLIGSGALKRICRGWYAAASADAQVVRAVRMGARLGCISGCRAHGLWIPEGHGLHLMYNPGTKPFTQPDTTLHRLPRPCHTAVAPLEDCLAHVLHHHDAETGLVVLESAVEKGLLDPADARGLVASTLSSKQRGLQHFTPGAGSGSETRVRLFLQRRNVEIQTQVHIAGVGRVDLLVGKSLIIECDSASHHSTPETYEQDRRRDMAAQALGYTVIRLSYSQIWHTWGATMAFLSSQLRTRRHLRAPTPPL